MSRASFNSQCRAESGDGQGRCWQDEWGTGGVRSIQECLGVPVGLLMAEKMSTQAFSFSPYSCSALLPSLKESPPLTRLHDIKTP